MASYNEDPIDRALSYWADDGSEWDRYKEKFSTYTKSQRIDALLKTDEFLAGDLKPTHETASLWTKRRELEHLHRTLDRLGK
jgi:hypothetical protein